MARTRMRGLIILNLYGGARQLLGRWIAHPRAPHVALAVVCVLGVGARTVHLGIPAYTGNGRGYIFDESYYVAAAHVIGGKPAVVGDVYAHASPADTDPNGEHPQLGKVIIAGGIALFGNNAAGWRITAVMFGTVALLLLYWLVRCAGGTPWLAVGASALGSFDNLWVVSSRIAVLDIYVIPFMLAGVALYLRRRPILAALALGVGGTVKEFAAYALIVVLLIELMRALRALWDRRLKELLWTRAALRLARPAAFVLLTGIVYFTAQTALDAAVTPYSGGHRVDRNQASICNDLLIWKGACNHFTFMNRYAAKLRNSGPPKGIASYPTQFWLDEKEIPYYKVTRTVFRPGHPPKKEAVIWFRGEISHVLLFTAWAALLLNAWWAIRRRDDLSFLVLAWTLGTWLPPELFNAIGDRTTYLYYMVVVMPGLYMAVSRLLGARRIPRWVVAIWVAGFLWDFASLYPFRTLSGS